MHINTDSLHSFLTIQKCSSFTLAAQELGISQSALSQKIKRLEDQLQTTLFIRANKNLELTSSGQKLLIFAKQQLNFEADFLSQFDQYQSKPAGVIRVAGFSSVTRSILIPATSNIMLNNPGSQVEFSSFEIHELEEVLKKNQADLIVTDYKVKLPGIEQFSIGREEYVEIEPKTKNDIPDVYLDHGPLDNATESFFDYQQKEVSYRRGFMGDVYGIIDGVKLGLGRAVMSKHLIKNDQELKIKRHKKRYFREVYVTFLKQDYYSPLHNLVIKSLKQNSNLS